MRVPALLLGVSVMLACKTDPRLATRVVLSGNDSTLVSIDTAAIAWRSDTAALWINYDLSRPVPFGDSAGSLVYRMEVLTDVHCPSSQAQDRRLHVFDKGDNLLRDEVLVTPGWQAFPQSSQTSSVYQPLCAALPSPKPHDQGHAPVRGIPVT